MKCPHCQSEITKEDLKTLPSAEIKATRAQLSGMISKRTINQEQQAKMQAGRKEGKGK